ncbi:transmembrane protein, putative (macronuclear) [Tetrahymena thermophila SB210]|uniref:Transmembrane protein, putative n=1 Tax=Tetrahymena thermophila (strain SB210) TaxID=312017 RepID=I7MFV4_TETTS|nr:transmembrane protein, putative [Tetrahymena thermophila SB210]EAS00633.3 transmembrane protein, putative [Tetrahymena thermophila SB210]|eukprot:XP_001020878.3 transmembrane protein, putative [Tetrahymena thermophila SB210]
MLYQLSKKTYSNLYSANKGYLFGEWLKFLNNKIEQRFIKGCFISNIQSQIKMHLIQFILTLLDLIINKQYAYFTYLNIVLSVIYLIWIKKAQSVYQAQIFSFILQFYFFFRFAQLDLPYELYILLLCIWGINNVISYKSMVLLFLLMFTLLSQGLKKTKTLLWPFLFSLNNQRDIFSFQHQIYESYKFSISELEVEYFFISSVIYYYILRKTRLNWKALDQVKRSERAYVNLFQQIKTPTFVVNHQGNILELNETGRNIFGERLISYANCSFFKLFQNKQELENVKLAFEQASLTKETINIRANIKCFSQSGNDNFNSFGGNEDQQKDNKSNNTVQNQKNSLGGNAPNGESSISNSNTRNGISKKSNESSVQPSPQLPSLGNKKQSIASPPIRHNVQMAMAPPQPKNIVQQKIPYPFLQEQFDDLLKNEYLHLTQDSQTIKYFNLSISPYIWKETTSFLISFVDISDTQDFIKMTNFFMKNVNDRIVSVLSHTEEDYQKWGNLAQLSQIKQTDLRELSAIISEQHNIFSLTSLVKYFNQMYIGHEKGKLQDFQITNLIIQTIEVHSVRVQNYLKRIDLTFESFPPQVNGDPSAFYFIIHNLIYLITYNCEYNEVDLSLSCKFLSFVDKNNSLILSFDFEFSATQEQIEFFQKLTKKFDEFKRYLVQSDLKGHDILETLYLMTLNSIKQNEGNIHIDIVDPSKKNDNNNQNQPASQQNIAAPQSQQLIKQEVQGNKDNQNAQDSKENIDNQVKKLKVVLEQVFNQAEMHTVVKRQQDNSIMDSPAVSPLVDKKNTARKHHALAKPPQINLSYTRFKEKQKDKYQWKQCNEEEKKQVAQIGLPSRRPNDLKNQFRKIQNFGIDSDENIPNPINRNDISPISVKPNPRKASTNTLNIGVQPSLQQVERMVSSGAEEQKNQQISNSQNNIQVNHPSSQQNIQIPQTHQQQSQFVPTPPPTNNKEVNQSQNLSQAPQILVPKTNSSGNINYKKNLENISESVENIDRMLISQKPEQAKQKPDEDSPPEINDFLSEDNSSILFNLNLKKEIKTNLKLYNSNIVRDISKIIKNILTASKMQEEFDVRFINKSSTDSLPVTSRNIAQFCSPQLHSNRLRNDNRFKASPQVHSAFAGYVNPDLKNQNKTGQSSNSRMAYSNTEETPKSVVMSTRPSKSNFPSMIINSPLVVNNFRFRGDSRGSECKDQLNINYKKQETKQLPWNEIIPFEVHQSRLKKHVRKWILQDLWKKAYKKTDTVLVVSAELSDSSLIQQVFLQKKDLGKELQFTKVNQAFSKYIQMLKDDQVYKYILVDLRIDPSQVEIFIQQIKDQESISQSIPKTSFVGYESEQNQQQYNQLLDYIIVGSLEVLKLLPFIKALKEKR